MSGRTARLMNRYWPDSRRLGKRLYTSLPHQTKRKLRRLLLRQEADLAALALLEAAG